MAASYSQKERGQGEESKEKRNNGKKKRGGSTGGERGLWEIMTRSISVMSGLDTNFPH